MHDSRGADGRGDQIAAPAGGRGARRARHGSGATTEPIAGHHIHELDVADIERAGVARALAHRDLVEDPARPGGYGVLRFLVRVCPERFMGDIDAAKEPLNKSHMSRVSAMASDARPHLPTEGAANSGCLFASRATTQMSAIAPKPEGTGLSGRSALSRISSRKASVAATRGLFRGSLT